MLPNLSVVWVILLLLVLTAVINRLLLRPVLEVIRKREEAIQSARELARRSAAEAQAATDEFDRKTTAARAEIYRADGRDASGRRRAARRNRRRDARRSGSGRSPGPRGSCRRRPKRPAGGSRPRRRRSAPRPPNVSWDARRPDRDAGFPFRVSRCVVLMSHEI